MAVIVPLKPASHVHPVGTSFPVESSGQLAAAQLPEKKEAHSHIASEVDPKL